MQKMEINVMFTNSLTNFAVIWLTYDKKTKVCVIFL